jgi:CubicO group peptidase (beta-lactamase class C family)
MKLRPVSAMLQFVILAALGMGGGAGRAEDIPAAHWKAAADYSAARRGLSFLVMQHGKVIGENYPGGHSSSEAHKIYSGTKGFWILAGLKASEEGIIALDSNVCDTIPEWRADPLKCKVTLRQLLNFNSGLDADNQLHGEGFADRDAIAIHVPLVAQPGHAFIYGPAPLQVFHEVLKRKLAARGETPTHYLEQKVLLPLGLGPQRYLADRAGNPMLATGFMLTARQWSRVGQLILRGGSPVLSSHLLGECFRGTSANEAFGMGFWNNHLAADPGAREFDVENMLIPKWSRQDWRKPCLCRAAPSDLVAAIGSGYQRLFVIPSMDLVVVRQGVDATFRDGEFLRLLLGR